MNGIQLIKTAFFCAVVGELLLWYGFAMALVQRASGVMWSIGAGILLVAIDGLWHTLRTDAKRRAREIAERKKHEAWVLNEVIQKLLKVQSDGEEVPLPSSLWYLFPNYYLRADRITRDELVSTWCKLVVDSVPIALTKLVISFMGGNDERG